MTWPERIRAIRAARGWSQQQLADHLRVRRATVSDWENGHHAPSGPASVLLERLEEEARGARTTDTEAGTGGEST